MCKGYLSRRRTAKAQATLRIHAVSPDFVVRSHNTGNIKEPEIVRHWIVVHAHWKHFKPYDAKVPFFVRRLK